MIIEDIFVVISKELIKQLSRFGTHFSDFYLKPIPNRRLLTFVVSITTRCNFNCPHCLRSSLDKNKTIVKDLFPSVFETVLKEGKKIDFQEVSISGGEPILHPQFGNLISLINRYDYKFNFTSNGWFYKEYWKAIKQNLKNLKFIFLSLDGVTAEVHDAVRNKPGSFARLMEAIKFYREQGAPLIITFCVTKKNYHQIEKLPKFCLRHGIRFIKWIAVMPQDSKSYSNSLDDILTDSERVEVFQKILNLHKKFRNQCAFIFTSSFLSVSKILNSGAHIKRGIDFCAALNGHSFYIDPEGGMLFCCDLRRDCKNKPLIQDLGFEKSFKITLDTINEIKKKFMGDLLNNPGKINRICDFCNDNVESCLKIATEKHDGFFFK